MITKAVFERVLHRITSGAIAIDYWGAERKTYGVGKPYVTVVLKDQKTLTEILRKGDMGFGEAYMDGRVQLEHGSMLDFLRFYNENRTFLTSKLGKRLVYHRNNNAKKNQLEQIHTHYDLGNDFYKLWLDDTMTYTCAYYHSPKDTLEQAQRQKIDHVLRKLELQKGQEFIELGCGWGYLSVRAAKIYGAKGVAVTLSKEQYEFGKALAKKEGVDRLVTFKHMNYQDLIPSRKQYDRVVSVGMLEHVGQGNLRNYFDVVDGLLKPGGISVLHSITQQKEVPVVAWFDKYIFPGGYIPSLRETIAVLPEYGFRTIDVENLRPHYALTLREWLKRFEAHVPEITAMYDERFIRMWRFYLCSSTSAFELGDNDLSQIIFTKGINDSVPMTRTYLYK
jgi:cyclopropane-fatty-acyl-phospholipid synthase